MREGMFWGSLTFAGFALGVVLGLNEGVDFAIKSLVNNKPEITCPRLLDNLNNINEDLIGSEGNEKEKLLHVQTNAKSLIRQFCPKQAEIVLAK